MRPIELFGHPTVAPNRKKLHTHYYESIYLETLDGAVKNLGLTMRCRIEDDVSYVYVKKCNRADGALSSRDEWRVKTTDIQNAARLLASRGAPTKPLIGKELFATGQVRFKRMDCLVFPKEGFSYMLSYDLGCFAEVFRFDEVELELVEGTEQDLFEAGEILAKDLSLEPEEKSKRERAIFYTKALYEGKKD